MTLDGCAGSWKTSWTATRKVVERAFDQPGGADRLIVDSTGVEHMWVNGVATRAGGQEVVGVSPGRLLRS